MAIDAVTGLPILGPTDIIDQIPLGSQIVPFEDLQATDRPNRVPYYPDDIIPTSALVTGQDSTGRARAGRMDTGRNLYVREAVFQSNGQPIPDGTTAPIDVNMSGGGGSGAATIIPFSFNQTVGGFKTHVGTIGPPTKAIRGIVLTYACSVGSIAPSGINGYVDVYMDSNSGRIDHCTLAGLAISWPASGTTERVAAEMERWFGGGIIVPSAFTDDDGNIPIYVDSVNITTGGDMLLAIYQDA